MKVFGKSVNSFSYDKMTKTKISIANFPIRKQDDDEQKELSKVLLLRKLQIEVPKVFLFYFRGWKQKI